MTLLSPLRQFRLVPSSFSLYSASISAAPFSNPQFKGVSIMPFGLQTKSVLVGIVVGMFVIPRVRAMVGA
jgi:hypothetical protein